MSHGGGLTENLDFSEVRAATGGSARVLAENSDFCHVSAASRGDGLPKNLDFLHGDPGGPLGPRGLSGDSGGSILRICSGVGEGPRG